MWLSSLVFDGIVLKEGRNDADVSEGGRLQAEKENLAKIIYRISFKILFGTSISALYILPLK